MKQSERKSEDREKNQISQRHKLTDNFYLDEFSCNCGCFEERISLDFVKRLQIARTESGVMFFINRGVSCPSHNEKVGGSPESAHVPAYMTDTQGHAADIRVSSNHVCYEIVTSLLNAGFTRIGVYKTFVHVDDADIIGAKVSERMWRD